MPLLNLGYPALESVMTSRLVEPGVPALIRVHFASIRGSPVLFCVHLGKSAADLFQLFSPSFRQLRRHQ